LCNILHSPVTSSLLVPNILLRTLFSNTLSLCSSLSVRDQVSHPYKTTGRIMILYILTFTFLVLLFLRLNIFAPLSFVLRHPQSMSFTENKFHTHL
jgi:phosphate starvation-inducible membrane PsiE